jgi:GntR family transcriptional regulator, sialic acid-inducible nan operon repressor
MNHQQKPRMNNVSKLHHAPGNDLAAAFGMSLRAGRNAEAELSHRHRESIDSSAQAGLPADPVRTVVADKLAHMIHIGLLDAGDPLPSERSLCEVFRVARQSVRGALGILEGRLMLAISHGRRSRVLGPGRLSEVDSAGALKRLRARQTSDIRQVLLVLDAEIASLSASNAKTQQLDKLDVLVTLLPEIARDPLCYLILDYEIRSLVYACCGNSLLADIAMDFYGHASPQRRQQFQDPEQIKRSSELHTSLAKALRQRDAVKAARIMKEQAEAIAAIPLRSPGPAEASSACTDEGEDRISTRSVPPLTRGAFWPAAAMADV